MSKILLFCCNIGFVAIYVLLWQICFVAIYALLCGEKIIQKLRMWRKNDKYQVWSVFASLPLESLSARLCCTLSILPLKCFVSLLWSFLVFNLSVSTLVLNLVAGDQLAADCQHFSNLCCNKAALSPLFSAVFVESLKC